MKREKVSSGGATQGAKRPRHGADRPLGRLGVDPATEAAYRALLERHAMTATELAQRVRITPRAAAKLLAGLETLGLATHTPRAPRAYVAAPPELAVAALIKQRQAELEKARIAVPELEARAARAGVAKGPEPAFELIPSGAHLAVLMAKIYESFRSEVMSFQRSPTLTLAPGGHAARGRTGRDPIRTISNYPTGVRVRTISDNSYLDIPGALAHLEADVIRGEEARVLPVLPFKMMIFDRRIAVIALKGASANGAPTLVIHGTALLEVMCQVFEFVWERATPVVLGHSGRIKAGAVAGRSQQQLDALIALLSVGFNDKAIASELGISSATLNRRMAELMRTTGTRSRFQLGWHSALAARKTR